MNELFDHLATYHAGVYAEVGVGDSVTIRVFGPGPKPILSCTVSAEAADEELMHSLEAFADRQRALDPALRLA